MSKNRPSDFGSFWYTVGKELAEIPVAPEVESIPMRSTDFADYPVERVVYVDDFILVDSLTPMFKKLTGTEIFKPPSKGISRIDDRYF